MTEDGGHDGQDTLEEAAAALREAEQAVRVARRKLSAAVVAAYRSGEPVAQIASRTGKDVYEIRNLLAATGTSRRA
jgi:multidrug resistance efflux pump